MTNKKRLVGGDTESVDSPLSIDQLARFANVLGNSLDARTLVEDALEPLADIAGADALLIALADEGDKSLVPAAGSGLSLSAGLKALPINAVASLGTEALAFDGGGDLPDSLSGKIDVGDGAVAVVPLWAHGRLRGVVVVRRKRPFSSASLKLLTAAGRQFALAVENSRLLSEMQLSYRALMDNQEEMMRAERLAAMGLLAATMAHEIRNPLATIFSAISQIRKHGNADGVSATLLNIAEEEAARLNTMVAGLLDFARPRTPSFESRRPLEIANEVAKTARDGDDVPRGVTIVVDPTSDDLTVAIDPELIQRALWRLVDNAVKSIDIEGTVTIRIRKGDGRKCTAVIEVEDDGCGIPRELLPRVFEPFFSTRPSGIGLGLPTVRRIAEDHGGKAEISSEPGRGTRVRVLLGPRGRSTGAEEEAL